MAKVLCLLNFKGGVGKTTVSLNLGAALARAGKKTLLIDLDAQGTATNTLKEKSPYDGPTIYDYLTGATTDPFAYETKTKKLHYVPSTTAMIYADVELIKKRECDQILRRFIALVTDHYDYIILDCPPGKGIITNNALLATDYVIIPMKLDVFSMFGLRDILNEVEDVRNQSSNSGIKLLGVLANEYDNRLVIVRDVEKSMQESMPGVLLDTKIHKSVSLWEFSAEHQSIFDYKQGRGVDDFTNLAKEVIKKTR